jgi:hyaluronoglucosaminidase
MTTSPFATRGVVEGFYGPPYTFPERDGLIAFLGRHGFNYYLYGPKNDREHRNRWREPYPAAVLARFASTVAAASRAGVRFCYALAPSVSIRYADERDFALICAKFGALYDVGVRDFCIFFDDINPALADELDRTAFASPAEAHAAVTNRARDWLLARDPACTLSMVPTDYYGVAPFSPYLHELGERLHPAIDIFYTGPDVCAATIGVAETRDFATAVRRPPIIWDNYPVNDLAMRPQLHIGPLRGRAPELHTVTRGFVANPMLQAEASRVPLATVAAYLADPHGYEPWQAWERAIAEAAGESAPALRAFADCSLRSPLGGPDAPRLEPLVAAALAALRAGEPPTACPALDALEAAIFALDDASYRLKNRMENLALRAELLPWIEALDCWYDAGWRAIAALRAAEGGEPTARLLRMMREYYAEALAHHKRYGGRVLAPLVEYALERVG